MNKGMAPEESPGKVGSKVGSGVRRVNNVPMYLLGGIITTFLVVMAVVAMNKAEKQPTEAQQKKQTTSADSFAREIADGHAEGIIESTQAPLAEKPLLLVEPPPVPQKETPSPLPATVNLDMPPPPPSGGNLTAPPDDEAVRIKMAKLQQFEEAVKAKTGVQVVAPRSSGSLSTRTGQPTRQEMLGRIAEVRQQVDAQRDRDNPTAAYQERLSQIRSSLGSGPANLAAAPQLLAATPQPQNATTNANERWKLDSQPQAPRAFEIRAGFVVPATLISGINSDLPGQITAQVAQNVYDTPTGKHLLIPLGARLVGSYSSEVKFGQARVLVAWQRIVFPDGKALDIGSMPGSDSAGYSGLSDQVNNNYLRMFGSALLMSGVTAGITYSQRQTQSVDAAPNASSALSEALGQQLGQVTAQLIAKNLSVSPTLEIRPGYRFNVVVTKDMAFSKPYRSFDY